MNLTNSDNPSKKLHNAAFHLGFHCLPKYHFKGLGQVHEGLIMSARYLGRLNVLF